MRAYCRGWRPGHHEHGRQAGSAVYLVILEPCHKGDVGYQQGHGSEDTDPGASRDTQCDGHDLAAGEP